MSYFYIIHIDSIHDTNCVSGWYLWENLDISTSKYLRVPDNYQAIPSFSRTYLLRDYYTIPPANQFNQEYCPINADKLAQIYPRHFLAKFKVDYAVAPAPPRSFIKPTDNW